MPPGRGKEAVKVVLPVDLKAELDAEAAAQGIDRSALILARLAQGSGDDGADPWASLQARLDHQERQLAGMQETLRELVTALHEVLAAVRSSSTPRQEPAYPVPASLEETYPELYAPKAPAPVSATPTPEPVKRWSPWRR
jgi:hypothetical protein